MKKRSREISIFVIILIVFALIFLGIYLNLESFNSVIREGIERFGYFGILVFGFLADLLEQPIGPEVPASFGIIFGLNIWMVFGFVLIGSHAGSLVSYYIGRKYFYKGLKKASKNKIKSKHYKLFDKYGGAALALAAISPIPWVAFCWLAGGMKMKLKHFVLWGLIPRTLRIGFIMGIVWYAVIFV